MVKNSARPNTKQALFRNMLVGVLLYSVVLGFFNDYTKILHTGTYSVTFSLATVMQILTYLTFALKDWVVTKFRPGDNSKYSLGLIFSIWLIMFVSKFVFLAVISFIFPEEVHLSGFVGLIIIIVCLTLAQKLVELADSKLGQLA